MYEDEIKTTENAVSSLREEMNFHDRLDTLNRKKHAYLVAKLDWLRAESEFSSKQGE
jgi:hypothetical protein